MKQITRAATHGTQRLYRLGYRDASGDGPTWHENLWAYNEDHALERFSAACSEDPYWDLLSVDVVRR